ncbi:MAG TPA: MdtA/MuxA family multidrug efflux RND transporter periplasmic adaptor subunit [Thermoanaerobaculia bacterium]|nr:MdtA/MuxA family multidrug efflux RND transporter periplasmic adaptor subunit [Thermoanaerobaculia bacterium]
MSEAPPASKTDKKTDPQARERAPQPPPAPPDTQQAHEPRRRHPWRLALLAIFAAVAALLAFHHRGQAPAQEGTAAKGAPGGKGGQSRPVPVLATSAQTKDVGVYLTGLGNVAPLNTVSVKSRVDGQLLRIDFREGQMVRAGDLLADIDPRPFQVQLMQAEGQKAKDEAALHNAQVDLQRYQVLYAQDSIAKQQLDTQAATVAQVRATIQSDQAQIESAKLNLTYSRVTAPTGGRVGLRQVDVGNVVHAGDANGIVVITQLQPIDVLFTIPADHLPQVLPQVHSGKVLAVDAYDRELKRKLAAGKLLAVDNQVDPTTGTVRLKAQFPNGDEALFPDQFVNARLLVNVLRGAVTVPTAAIQRSPQSTYVYVVKPDHTVENRNVVVELTEGDDAVIQSGLAAGDLVIVDGVDKLRPGMKVDVTMADAKGGRGARKGAAS